MPDSFLFCSAHRIRRNTGRIPRFDFRGAGRARIGTDRPCCRRHCGCCGYGRSLYRPAAMRRRFGGRLWLRFGAVFVHYRCGACFRLNWAIGTCLAGLLPRSGAVFTDYRCGAVFSAALGCQGRYVGYLLPRSVAVFADRRCGAVFSAELGCQDLFGGFAAAVRRGFRGLSSLCVFRSRLSGCE